MKEQEKKTYPLKPHAFKGISVEQLLGLKEPPPVTTLYHWEGTKGEITVPSRGLTLVVSRAVRENVRMAADICVRIARENPDRPVWYVNTYAGVDLLKEVMLGVIRDAGLAEPVPNPVLEAEAEEERDIEAELKQFLPDSMKSGPRPERPWEQWVQSRDGKNRWFRVGDMKNYDRQLDENRAQLFVKQERERIAKLPPKEKAVVPPPPVLPNLHVFDIPLGEWDAEALLDAIGDEEASEENAPVVIINSFEYCPLNRSGKWRMARELLGIMEEMPISLVVFSQEVRQDIVAGMAGRGSVGLLAGRATHVARMADPFEHMIRSRKPRNQPDTATVHEAQMHAARNEQQADSAQKPRLFGPRPGAKYDADGFREATADEVEAVKAMLDQKPPEKEKVFFF